MRFLESARPLAPGLIALAIGLTVGMITTSPTSARAADGLDLAPHLDHRPAPPGSLLLDHDHSDRLPPGGLLLAQADGEDAYDPFADYSEFEESVEEEEDINFFRNGRLFTMGFIGGYRGWTQSLANTYSGSPGFGLYLCYFFDLRFALQFGFLSSDNTLIVKGTDFVPVQGSVSISDLQFVLKYYFNTQNVTKGLADLNPYLVGGFSQIYRTTIVSGNDDFAKDSALGFNVGAGIEIPMMRNKMYFGLQGNYQLVNFADEARVVEDEDEKKTGITLAGDSFLVLGILGINF